MRGSAKRCSISKQSATRPPSVTRTGTFGTGRTACRGSIGYTWSYAGYIILQQIDDVQCFFQTRSTWKKSTTVYTEKLCIGSRALHCRTVLVNRNDKAMKASPKQQSIEKHSLGLPQDVKPLRNSSGNWAKMLLKSHLEINYPSQYFKDIRLLQQISSNS